MPSALALACVEARMHKHMRVKTHMRVHAHRSTCTHRPMHDSATSSPVNRDGNRDGDGDCNGNGDASGQALLVCWVAFGKACDQTPFDICLADPFLK